MGPGARILCACCLKLFWILVVWQCETQMEAYSSRAGKTPEQQQNMTALFLFEEYC